jgi:hypothetical protein
MESVDFQSTMLYKQLTAVFAKLTKSSPVNAFIDASLEIQDAVKHATDLSFGWYLTRWAMART